MFVDFFIFSYSDIIIEREVLMQKYIHLVQIVETEKVAANQLRTQLEDQDTEIERLKSEVQACMCTHTRKILKISIISNPIFMYGQHLFRNSHFMFLHTVIAFNHVLFKLHTGNNVCTKWDA